MQIAIKISDDKYKLIKKIAKKKDRPFRWVIDKAVLNLAKATKILRG